MTRLYPFYRIVLLSFVAIIYLVPSAWAQDLKDQLSPAFKAIEPKVIKWRRDIHQHPELSNREFRTAKLVAEHLRKLGMEVQTGVAHTGVVGTLRGGMPGPVVALRADMDALPVTEMTDVPFASKVKTTYDGQEVGVMHACGHDAHTAMLMGTAEILAGIKEELPGIIKFFFQPAEEGAPPGEEGGAKLMIKERVLDGPDAPKAIFAVHVAHVYKGIILYRAGESMAAYDSMHITVQGRQTHGARPWEGVDPIRVSGQIITALLEMFPSQYTGVDVPAVVSIGSIHGGVRENIIPGEVVMKGTIRTFEREMRKNLVARIQRTVDQIAERAGAKAIVRIENDTPVAYNDPDLTYRMLPSLHWAAGGAQKVAVMPRDTGSEDFAYFQEKIPGMYIWLGVNKQGVRYWEASPPHSPSFYVNEDTLIVGVRALAGLTIDYLNSKQ
jgi:amidohydrolase